MAIREWHSSFLSAGATVLETNTFGANAIVLSEYGLADRVAEINRAAVGNAREAIRKAGGAAYVAGSIGPTTKLPSLGHIAFQPMAAAFAEQAKALIEAGADLLIVETCQDLLQVKIALISCFGVVEAMKRDVPVMVSLTIENTGTMLVGTDVAAALAAIEPFPVFSVGLNCATGPGGMTSHVRYLCRHYRGRVSCIPNAGIPQVRDGKTHYPLSPEAFAAQLAAFVRDEGVSIVGGCCGTTPEHIRKLREALEGIVPSPRNVVEKPSLSSLYQAAEIRQEIPPFLIGERCNANGSKRFRDLLLADDYPGALRVALEQQEDGAHAVDLCTAYAGRDEQADLSAMVRLFAQSVQIPTVIDSTTPDCIEAALKIHPGRCLVNSVNLEDGGKNLERVCRLAKTDGAAPFRPPLRRSPLPHRSGGSDPRRRRREHPRGDPAGESGAPRRLHAPRREQRLLRSLPRLPEGAELRLPARGGGGRARRGDHRRGKSPADVEDPGKRSGSLPRPDPRPPEERCGVPPLHLPSPFRRRETRGGEVRGGREPPGDPPGGGAGRKGGGGGQGGTGGPALHPPVAPAGGVDHQPAAGAGDAQ